MQRLEALADPLRLAVARHLAAHPSASAPEVAAGVEVHLNTARAHLAALLEAGVIERVSEGTGRRGRPTVRYRLIEGWAPEGEELLPLSALLATAVRQLKADPGELHDVGRDWGYRWAGASGFRGAEERLTSALSRLGFRTRLSGGRLELSGCPCPLVAPDVPELICALADGVTDGALEDSRVVAVDRRHAPRKRRCSATLRAQTSKEEELQ